MACQSQHTPKRVVSVAVYPAYIFFIIISHTSLISRAPIRHERYGKSYAPLQWSQALKEESKVWAEKLAEDCDLEHDPDGRHGENIALNYGWGSSSGRRTTENILTRECYATVYCKHRYAFITLTSLCHLQDSSKEKQV